MTAGPRGPQLLQDVWYLEKMAHFDREVIPERRMHAKGSGAYGTFTVTHDITKYTRARIFSEIGKKTEMFARFSTVAGERRAADAERNIRGFALKFYTEEGNWDLVGNNTPVFFLRDPLKFSDLTKVWYKKDYPLIEVGIMELNKNPENYFAEVEQAAFNPANVVPGISFSPDKMLQRRLFSYGDTQRYRLGINHHLIPVNRARCPVHSYHRDGQMRVDGNYGTTLGYEPNSYGDWQEQPDFSEPPLELSGAAAYWNARDDDSDYSTQPGKLFRRMDKKQQKVLFDNTARAMDNTARAMDDAPEMIKIRHIANCLKADPAYGEGVAKALDIPLSKVLK